MKFKGSKLNVIFIGFLFVGLVLGCIGRTSVRKCEGSITVGNKNYWGAADTKDQAGLNVCNNFCIDTDPEFERRFNEWRRSPEAEKEKRWLNRPLIKRDTTKDKRNLKYLTEVCAPRCVREANKGKHTLKVKCK